jgi:hypothetical protein
MLAKRAADVPVEARLSWLKATADALSAETTAASDGNGVGGAAIATPDGLALDGETSAPEGPTDPDGTAAADGAATPASASRLRIDVRWAT